MKKLILIDGNSLIYRAFYALPQTLATSAGQITNAVYGFTSMLVKLLETEKPSHMAVAFDRPEPTFRHAEYTEYKAHRIRMPDELQSQFPIVKEILQAMRIPTYELQGFEADDVLAALAKRAEAEGYEVIIVTGDRDALQLISPRVKTMATRTGITDTVVYDREKVIERYGIPPEKIPDFLGLKGDVSDNIPGIPGIGDKIASKLVQQYGSVEEVVAHAEEIPAKKIREALLSHGEQAKMSKGLAVLKTDLPLDIDLDESHLREWNEEELKELFTSLEFNTLLKRLFPQDEKTVEAEELELKILRVQNTAEGDELLENLSRSKMLALAVVDSMETPADCGFRGLAIAREPGSCYYLSGDGPLEGFLQRIGAILGSTEVEKTAYAAKPLCICLTMSGLGIESLSFDPAIAAYLLDSTKGDYPLSYLAEKYLGLTVSEAEEEERAACQRAALSLKLREKLEPALQEKELWHLFRDLEMPLMMVLARMEMAGVGVDVEHLRKLGEEIEEGIARLTEEISILAGHEFNLNSPQQLSTVLFKELGLIPRKKTKTGLATGAEVLNEMLDEHPIIQKILQHRELSKLRSTYVFALPRLVNAKTGRLHTTFNQTVTSTGRLSSSNPNLQNIPIRTELGREIRKAFIPAQGSDELLIADYSQIELRLLAYLSQDENLLAAFESGQDIHQTTAAEVFGVSPEAVTPEMRRRAKVINFGILYGMTAFGLAKNLGTSDEEAQEYIDNYFARYPRVQKFTNGCIQEAHEKGYTTTILKRRRDLPELKSKSYRVRQFGERLAVNTPLQGSAADIIKLAMLKMDAELRQRNLTTRMVLQVHDELVFEVPPQEKEEVTGLVREVMENVFPPVKLNVEIKVGPNWNDVR
jgi:DNA polymerase-1